MGDPDGDKKSGGVPSWQLKPSDATQELPKESQDAGSDQTPSRASIIEHARRFLLEDEVRNAPTDKQVSFLEAKGLESHEIQELLGVTRNVEASSSNSEPSTPLETPPKETSSQQPIESPSSSPAMTQSTRDVPPIITYPEFLVTPSQPAPLITARRLLGTLYLFGGLSALSYGTNLYLITPMIAALTASRHELAGTAQENLDKLIAKLEGMASEAPPKSLPATHHEDSEDEDSDSDPTELFHRDIGIQTSLPTSPSLSRPTSPAPTPTITATDSQASRLSQLSSHITDLNDASTSEGQEVSELSTCVGILREYLESLAYVSPSSYTYGTTTTTGGLYGGGANQKNEAADDEVAKVKAQIRGVKGVLLSARSFPAGNNWQGRVR